jgi:hypothetical protein
MSLKFKTRDVSKSFYRNYLQKAEECLHAARNSFSIREWNASAISAIHAGISHHIPIGLFLSLKLKKF